MTFKIKYIESFPLLFLFVILPVSLFALETTTGGQLKLFQDSSFTKLTLPNSFLKSQMRWQQKIKISEWVFQNKDRIYSDFTLLNNKSSQENHFALSEIDWQLTTPGHSLLDLDYRESSLFVPANVREFMEYKMGRSRFIPIVTLAGATFLAYHIYQKYGQQILSRAKEKYLGINLDERELTLIKILWQYPGINVTELYSHVEVRKNQLTYRQTETIVKSLEKKYLVNPRQLIDDNILYFPALSKQELVLKLKDEITQLDGILHAERLKKVNELLSKFE